jgi:hypothetical protein
MRRQYSREFKSLARGSNRVVACCAGLLAMAFVGASAQDSDRQLPEDELRVVDCLLPAPVRRMGTIGTRLGPRRLVRLVARDCQRQHGEYVAFDAANYEDSLALWLEAADTGDPVAQTFVGEFYEQGLGVAVDYERAAEWYRPAAEVGHTTAQLHLAYLYAQGLGVPRDPLRALELYSDATGIEGDSLVFESDLLAERAEAQRIVNNLTRQLEQQNELVESVRAELVLTQQELGQRRADLQTVESEVLALQRNLEELKSVADGSRQLELEAIEQQLAMRESELNRRSQDVAILESEQAHQRELLADEMRKARERDASLQARIEEQNAELQGLRLDLSAAQARLYEADKREAELSTQIANERLALAAEREEFAGLRETFTEERQAEISLREERIESQQREIDGLKAQQRAALEEVVALRAREKRLLVQQANSDQTLSTVVAELAGARQRLLENDQRIADLTAELSLQRQRNERERSLLAASGDLLDAEVERLRGTIADREAQMAQQEALIASLREESRDYRNQIDELRLREPEVLASVSPPPMRSISSGFPPSRSFMRKANLGEYHALVIGNSDYDTLEDLESAVMDARAMADVLESRYGFTVQLLENATESQILEAIYSYMDEEELDNDDSLLIFYAGHGAIDPREPNLSYWLPVDADTSDQSDWISDERITGLVDQIEARHVMIIADSCYSGAMARNSTFRLQPANAGDPEGQEALFSMLAQLRSRIVLTSGGLQPVMSGGGGNHSVFAAQLLERLQNNQNVLDARSLYTDLYDRVVESAASFDVDQTPQYSQIDNAGHAQGQFLFLPIS